MQEVARACPTCRGEAFFDELENDKEADKIAAAAAKTNLSSAELVLWRQRKTDGLQLSKRSKQSSVQAMQLAIREERDFSHAVIVSRSPSSRAVCACCSEQISCGALRVHRVDGRFSHVTCHDMAAELQNICAGERIGLGEVHVSVETNIVNPQLMRPDLMEIRRADPAELRALRQTLTNAAGMSQWFCESPPLRSRTPRIGHLCVSSADAGVWESGDIHQNSGNIWGRAADERLGLIPQRPAAPSPQSPQLDVAPTAPGFARLMQAFVFDALFGETYH